MPRELPQFYMFPRSHVNIFFLGIKKEARKLKESCLGKGRVPLLVHSPEVWELPRVPPLRSLPYNFLLSTYLDMKRQILKEKAHDKSKLTCAFSCPCYLVKSNLRLTQIMMNY